MPSAAPSPSTVSARAPSSRRRRLPRTLLAAGVFVATLGLIEVGARVYLGDEFVAGIPTANGQERCGMYDPDIGWVNRPDTKTRVVHPRFAYVVEINSRGLRDREHTYEPQPGVFRIALLGDSIAWGWGVDDGQSFPDQLEDLLGSGVEVINLAVPGYGTDQQLWILEREGRRYRPDLVLVCFVLNDVYSNSRDEGHGKPKPRYVREESGAWRLDNHPVPEQEPTPTDETQRGLAPWLKANSAILELMKPGSPERDRLALIRTPSASELELVQTMCDEVTQRESVTYMLLGRLAALCAELEAPLFVFSVPHGHDRYLYSTRSAMPDEVTNGPRPFRTLISRRLAQVSDELGFETLSIDQDLLDVVRTGVDLHVVTDSHLNRLGNEVVAEALARLLAPHLP